MVRYKLKGHFVEVARNQILGGVWFKVMNNEPHNWDCQTPNIKCVWGCLTCLRMRVSLSCVCHHHQQQPTHLPTANMVERGAKGAPRQLPSSAWQQATPTRDSLP